MLKLKFHTFVFDEKLKFYIFMNGRYITLLLAAILFEQHYIYVFV